MFRLFYVKIHFHVKLGDRRCRLSGTIFYHFFLMFTQILSTKDMKKLKKCKNDSPCIGGNDR